MGFSFGVVGVGRYDFSAVVIGHASVVLVDDGFVGVHGSNAAFEVVWDGDGRDASEVAVGVIVRRYPGALLHVREGLGVKPARVRQRHHEEVCFVLFGRELVGDMSDPANPVALCRKTRFVHEPGGDVCLIRPPLVEFAEPRVLIRRGAAGSAPVAILDPEQFLVDVFLVELAGYVCEVGHFMAVLGAGIFFKRGLDLICGHHAHSLIGQVHVCCVSNGGTDFFFTALERPHVGLDLQPLSVLVQFEYLFSGGHKGLLPSLRPADSDFA